MAPTILIIPGAWHQKAAVESLVEKLKARGHPVQSVQLESVGGSATINEDAVAIGKVVGTLTDQGKDVLLVPHSYAGAASAPIQKEYAKVYRQEQGKPGGIIGLVYIAAFLSPEGPTLEEVLGGKLAPWQIADEKNVINVEDPVRIFYGDLSPQEQEKYVSLLKHQSLSSFRSPIGHSGFKDSAYDGKRAYIHTENDGALPPRSQEIMRQQTGVDWEVKSMSTSHSPFISKPDEVAQFLVEKAEQFSS